MFATLIVALPSKHTGGEVRLTHVGKTKVFETSQNLEFDASYLAWYDYPSKLLEQPVYSPLGLQMSLMR